MGLEIERKFLVNSDLLPPLNEGTPIHQGYMSFDPTTVRVRTKGTKAYLTVKGPGTLTRSEFEYEIHMEDALSMLLLTTAQLKKVRHVVRCSNTLWELDVFTHLAGVPLVVPFYMAEVELASEDAPFFRPEWLGKEVTEDPSYTNSSLAFWGLPVWPRMQADPR